MNLEALKALDLDQIQDPIVRESMVMLLNLVEELSAENQRLRAENQRLRDENNRLKGEQGKPDIKAGKKKGAPRHDSERERRRPRRWKKRAKVSEIRIDREKVQTIAAEELPADAVFKGYEAVVVQDVKIKTDNVRFWKAKYYSPSEGRSYLAPLPAGYEGEFGPGIRSLVLAMSYGSRMTQPALAELLENIGIHISRGQLSNMLVHKQDRFHEERQDLFWAGLASSDWQALDATGMRWQGENVFTQVLANDWYALFTTKQGKDRQSVLDVLRGNDERSYLLNEEALDLLAHMGLSAVKCRKLAAWQSDKVWPEHEFLAWLEQHVPGLGPRQRQQVLDAAAIAAYHASPAGNMLDILLTDDAREYLFLVLLHALCWVHEGRHYKKLEPVTPPQQAALDAFQKDFWAYYRRLLAYRQQPSEQERARLQQDFDALFSRKTSYWALNERIALTKAKRERLLQVLEHPQVPLHTNLVERDIRAWVRKRKISAGVRSEAGALAWDTFLSLAVTARKLGVSFYHYLYDLISETYALPSLADLVRQQSMVHAQALAPP